MRNLRLAVIVIVTAFSLSNLTVIANAADNNAITELPRIRSCEFQSSVNCIVSIKGILPNGLEITAQPTGRTEVGDFEWGRNSKVVGPADEWEFPGVKFQSGTGKFTLNTFYFPDGLSYCWSNGQCNSHQEQLNFYAMASNFGGLGPMSKLSGKKAEQWCPTNPNNCEIGTGFSFNNDMKWIVTFSMKNDFVPTISTGRIKLLKVAYENSNTKNLTIEFAPLMLDHVPYDRPDIWIYEEAFYQNDSPALWVHGNKHDLVQSLGKCVVGGGLQVVSNAIGVGVPTWNAKNESIEVWVKSPHIATDGNPLKGYLEVRIPREMAKCLWSVDLNGQISGKVSITYADSITPEILTVTGSVVGNDYLMVSTGYHYSSPTIAIQLKDTKKEDLIKSATEVQSTPLAASSKISTKKSVTCKKGSKVKKVTAPVPKCPVGYKKVA
jgi:hypothetical protein